MAGPNSASAPDAASVRPGFEFDTGRLADWMDANIAGFAGPISVTQFSGGQSNPTYRIATPANEYVLRRKPPGPLLKGAHAIEREVEVLLALGRVGYPVARVHGLCSDETVIGTAFYVMDLVAGRIFWDARVPEVQDHARAAIYDAMNAAIASLHVLDPIALGLEGFGKPQNYVGRQIERWSRQYRDDEAAGRSAAMDELIGWLERHDPGSDETALVHGDYRIDNVIFDPVEPRVLAVLDWELSTLGHPIADFAYHAMTYRMPPHIVAGLAGADLAVLNIPTEAEYIAAYCHRTGRAGIDDYPFYLAFNFFRLAAIFHGIKGRLIRGNASSAQARERAEAFPELAELGLLAAFDLTN